MSLPMRYRLDQAASRSGVAPELILQFVSRTWIIPIEAPAEAFDDEDLARIRLICDLRDKLGLNDEAVPVVMHLIDQLNRMHLELKPPQP